MDGAGARRGGGPQRLGDILPALRKKWGLSGAAQNRTARLEKLLKDIVGPEIAPKVAVKSYKNGRLVVEVGDHSLLQEISSFYKKGILDDIRALQKELFVSDIKFCIKG